MPGLYHREWPQAPNGKKMHVNLIAKHQYHFPSSFKDLQTESTLSRAVAGDFELEQQNGEIAPWTLCPSPASKLTTYCVMPRQATLSPSHSIIWAMGMMIAFTS